MSAIEDIVWEAHELGVRTELFNHVTAIREEKPNIELQLAYDLALSKVKEKINGTST